MTAKNKMMDMMARRDHSEKELRQKLREKFDEAATEDAIEYAKVNNWLPDPEVLSGRIAMGLHRRNKGIRSINGKLREKGLPPVKSDAEQELEKALALAQTKLSGDEKPDKKAREKLGRFLLSRGFDSAVVRKVIYEKL